MPIRLISIWMAELDIIIVRPQMNWSPSLIHIFNQEIQSLYTILRYLDSSHLFL